MQTQGSVPKQAGCVLSRALYCAVQLPCAMFEARLKTKISACYYQQTYGFSHTEEGSHYERAEMTIGRPLKCTG